MEESLEKLVETRLWKALNTERFIVGKHVLGSHSFEQEMIGLI